MPTKEINQNITEINRQIVYDHFYLIILNILFEKKKIYFKRCILSIVASNTHIPEKVPLTISYHLYFLRISKVWGMLHHGSMRRVQSKKSYFMFTYNFLVVFCCFSSKSFYFCFFFWWNIKFPQQNINQSETGIGDKIVCGIVFPTSF